MNVQFTIVSVRTEPHAAAPTLVFRVRVEESSGSVLQAALLRCQLYIEVRRRPYSIAEGDRLHEIVGDRERWLDTMRPLLWTTVPVVLSRGKEAMDVDVPVSCSYDFEVASSKYFHSLDEGAVPLLFLFNGTLFSAGTSALQVEQVPWDTEARFRLPISTWRQAMEQHFGKSVWVRLHRENFDALDRVRRQRGLVTWDQVVEALCADSRQPV